MNKQSGFTLIEIVMVLVLLGILSAVAVPKYFDLQAEAEKKSVMAIGAEYQARLNAYFAQQLLEGKACNVARKAAIGEANNLASATGAEGATGDFTITKIADTTVAETAVLKIKMSKSGGNSYDVNIAIPQCSNNAAPDSTND